MNGEQSASSSTELAKVRLAKNMPNNEFHDRRITEQGTSSKASPMRTIRTILLFLCVSPVAAQWEHTGPYGAWNSCHATVSGADLVGGSAGLFKSTDGGQTWAPWGEGLPSEDVIKLHRLGAVLYAGVDQEGLYRSFDDGLTWSACNNAAMGNPYDITGINDDGTDLLVSCNTGRFRSTDQGLTFTSLGSTPNYPGEMIALGGGLLVTRGGFNFPGDLYRSTDDGATWQVANNGLDATPGIGALYTNGTDLIAFGRHVYRSTDQGLTWTQITTTPLAYPPKYGCRIGDRFYFSSDGNLNVLVSRWDLGASQYTDIAPGLPDTWTSTIFGNAAGDVFINKARSLYRSTDNGATWIEQSAIGMLGAEVYSLLVEEDLVICGGYEGIHRSTDAGATWQRVASPEYTSVSGLHKNGNTVLAATSNGLLRSNDGGVSWPDAPLVDISLAAFTSGGGSLFVGGSQAGNATVRRSTDGGATWSNFSSGLPSQAGVLDVLASGTLVFAGVGAGPDGDPGVYRSAIGSAGWELVNTGMVGLAGTAFAMNQGFIYVGTENGVYRSNDQGTSWSAIGPSLSGVLVHDLAVVATNVVAATENGVFLLAPNTTDWTDITDDLLPADPLALATGIGNNYLYAATLGRSVARRALSTVGQQEIMAPSSLAIHPNPVDDRLWIDSEVSGTVQLVIHDMTGREVMRQDDHNARSIDVSDLTSGCYTLTILRSDGRSSARFIKP